MFRNIVLARAVCVVTLCALATGAAAWWTWRARPIANPATPLCAHWAVLRMCELHGAPIGMPDILRMIPPSNRGNSFGEMAAAFREMGLEVDARRADPDARQLNGFPCIAHLDRPGPHFVTVASVDETAVHVFDGEGRRTSWTIREFEEKWTGNVMSVRKPAAAAVLPTWRTTDGPRAQFDALFVDQGSVPHTGKTVAFAYRLTNVGNATLELPAIHPDCKCLDARSSSKSLAPGQSARIDVDYHLTSKPGPFFHRVFVETNDPTNRVFKLKAAGFIDRGVVVSPTSILIDKSSLGSTAEGVIGVHYLGDAPSFAVVGIESDIPGLTLRDGTDDRTVIKRQWPGISGDAAHQASLKSRLLTYHYQDPSGSGQVAGEVLVRTTAPRFNEIRVPFTVKSPQ